MPQDTQQIETFRLKVGDKPVAIRGRHWQTDRIYLNDVCLVVIVNPVASTETDNSAKEELYGLLRRISSRALHHNLMRPLAAIVQKSDDSKLPEGIANWGADQEWHRGEFTLYVEDGRGVVPTAEELLDTKLKVLTSTKFDPRPAIEVFPPLVQLPDPSPELRALHETTLGLLQSTSGENCEEKRVQALEAGLDRWREEIDPEIRTRG